MPRFEYNAISSAKKAEKGTITAENAFAARKLLRSRGLHTTQIKQLKSENAGGGFSFRHSNKKQVTEFTKELSTMLNAGIKLTEALSVLIAQIGDPKLRVAVSEIRDKVVTGESFAESLAEYEQYFDVIYVSMMRVGEVTGTLTESLSTMADFMDKQQRMAAKMTTAMIYPALLLVGSIAAVIIITIKVIPTIAEQITATGQELPWITTALLKFSSLLTSWWSVAMVAGLYVLHMLFQRLIKTQRGAYVKDKILLSLPGIGPLVKQRIVARFSSTLATLLGAGLSMAESLRVVSHVTGNVIMTEAVKKARERILSGADIATPLRDSGVIEPTIAHMVTVGEKSGELEQMLKIISNNLEASSDLVIERLSAAIEPVIIVFMAGVIGIIAYATLMPLIKFSAGSF